MSRFFLHVCLFAALPLIATTTAGQAHAAILFVSPTGADNPSCATNPCRTIQFALNQSVAGDTVLVAAGTYAENIFMKSGVHLMSNGGATIQGTPASPVVQFEDTGAGTVLEGFTVTGGKGGVVVFNASGEIRRNTIVGNTAPYAAGVAFQNGSGLVVNNLIRDNHTTDGSGAVGIEESPGSIAIVNNTIDGNSTSAAIGSHAMHVIQSNSVLVQNNIISNHNFSNLPAIATDTLIPIALRNNLFFNNPSLLFDGQLFYTSIAGLNARQFAQGNIEGNPLFVGAGDFHILNGSPAIDAGESANAPTVDIDGDTRPLGAGVDIGFDEARTGPPPVTQCSDGIDNDGDGLIDMADPGCTSPSDNDESNPLPPAVACNSSVATVSGLLNEVGSLTSSDRSKTILRNILNNVASSLVAGKNEKARTQLANFVGEVVRLSNLAETKANRIQTNQANSLVCGAANVVFKVPLP